MAFQKQSCSPLLVLVFSLGGALAQAPPSGIQPYEPYVPLYNGTEADLAFPGGAQHAIYTDPPAFPTGFYAQYINITACGYSTPHLHPGVAELDYILSGNNFIAGILFDTGDGSGYKPATATGLGTGAVATVPAGAVHYAQNPTCETTQLFQVLSGLQPGYTSVPFVDIPTVSLDLSAQSMQASYGLTDSQLQTALHTVTPIFAVDEKCLAACNLPAATGR